MRCRIAPASRSTPPSRLSHLGVLDRGRVAVAAAKLMGLDVEGIRQAAGIAEYHGPRSQMMRCIDYPSMVRDGVGWGAPTGVSAALLARSASPVPRHHRRGR